MNMTNVPIGRIAAMLLRLPHVARVQVHRSAYRKPRTVVIHVRDFHWLPVSTSAHIYAACRRLSLTPADAERFADNFVTILDPPWRWPSSWAAAAAAVERRVSPQIRAEVEALHRKQCKRVGRVQAQQLEMLRALVAILDVRKAFVEGLTAEAMPHYKTESRLLKAQEEAGSRGWEQMQLKHGAAGRLFREGRLAIRPLEEAAAQYGPRPLREAAMARNLARAKGIVLAVLGGAHDLRPLLPGAHYLRVTVNAYDRFSLTLQGARARNKENPQWKSASKIARKTPRELPGQTTGNFAPASSSIPGPLVCCGP
jgi:hypothetical protein